MARPTARVLALLEILQSGGVHRVVELAARLDVDERTVRRYIDHLLALDIPVESLRGRYGGYRLAAGFRMPPLMLTDDEAVAIVLGLSSARAAGRTGPADSAGAVDSAHRQDPAGDPADGSRTGSRCCSRRRRSPAPHPPSAPWPRHRKPQHC